MYEHLKVMFKKMVMLSHYLNSGMFQHNVSYDQ